MGIQNYKGLTVWQKAIDFVETCYKLSEQFPNRELYALSSQLRRAAVSVPSNIAEGNGRESRNEYIHFLNIARGSLKECETQLIIAERLKYISAAQLQKSLAQSEEIGRMLNALIRSLRR